MLRLKTLGNAFVTGDSGEPLGGAAAQRRTIALLAALAVAGDGGLSRDKLVGLLWPEADVERARHSLTQALYAARRSLGADDLFLVNADVRLNRERITSDVQDLEAALESGNLERAVALYTGPFLDGFFLAGSPEFEQWSSLQRTRLEGRIMEALERLAGWAETEGDLRRSIAWRRQLAVIRPLDSGNALKLMTSLMASGDRAGALQHAQLHELLLHDQLDLEPDAAVVALANKLRESGEPSRGAPVPDSSLPSQGTRGGLVGAAAETAGSTGADGSPASLLLLQRISARFHAVAQPVWREHRPIVLTALVFTAVLIAGSVLLFPERPATPPPPAPLKQRVVVAPFRVVGATSSLAYLRDGVVELLSTRLADDTAARAVDAGAVLRAWDEAGVAGSATLPRDSIVKLAGKLGAERVVIGSVIGTPRRMIVRASVAAVPSGLVHGEASVEGPADSISALIDELAAKLLVSEAGEDEPLASYTTSSLRALRGYLAGQAALRLNYYGEAMRHYRRALENDSSFTLAALRFTIAADRLNQQDESHQGIALAWPTRKLLSERDLGLLLAIAGPRYPMPSRAGDQLLAWRRLVELSPNNAESWYTYGARLFHEGALAGVAAPQDQAATLLGRVLAIDQDFVPANLLIAHLVTRHPAAETQDLARAVADSSVPFAAYLRWRHAAATNDSTVQRRIRSTMRTLGPANLRMLAMASQFDAMRPEDGALALSVLQSRPKSASEQVDLALGQHSQALLQGRPQAALEAGTRLAAIQPGSQGYLRLRVLDAIYSEGDTAIAAGAAQRLEALTTEAIASPAINPEPRLSNLCTTAQWRLSRADTVGVREAIGTLRRSGLTRGPTMALIVAASLCAELLDVWFAVLSNRNDALARLEQLDSLVLTPSVAGDAATYAPILMARLFERSGHPGRALQAIRKRGYMSGWPRYLATAWREEGRLAELTGDVRGGREAYDRYLALRASPERSVLPQVEEVRNRRAALRQEPVL